MLTEVNLDLLIDLLENLRDGNACVYAHKSGINHSQIKHFFDTRLTPELAPLFEIVLTHCLSSETSSAGSFTECVSNIIVFLKHSMCGTPPFKNTVTLMTSSGFGQYPKLEDIDRMLPSGSRVISSIIKDALDLAGFNGKIVVEKTHSETVSVEYVLGYSFSATPLIRAPQKKLNHPSVFAIDGYIDTVAQANKLLTDVASSKQEAVVFCRGMSDDVLHTVSVNNSRKTMSLTPLVVEFDLSGINTLVDVSVVAGCKLVSTSTGELLNNIGSQHCATVDSVTVTNVSTKITNRQTRNSVAIHTRNLREKRQDSVEDVQNLIDKRIKTLTSGHVVIRLPDSSEYVKNSSLIDETLRRVKSLVSHGTTINGDLASISVASNHYAMCCVNTLKDVAFIVS